MSGIALDALTVDQKKQMAVALRPFHTTRQLAELLAISPKQAFNWTRHMKIDLRRQSKRGKPSAERCNCADPISDTRFDRYCFRKTTCFRCGKVAK